MSLLVALALVLVGAFASEASASHYRHHNINWTKVSGAPAGQQRVTVNFEQSYRMSFFGGPFSVGDNLGCLQDLQWGDGESVCPDYIVEFVNNAEDYMRVQAVVTGTTNPNIPHDYADPNGTYTITGSGNATLSSLNNAADQSWFISSTVNLAGDDESAVSTIPTIVTLAPGGVRTFNVPANDAGGETLFFRLSTAQESCFGCLDPHPPGISINSSTGQVTLDTTGLDGVNWSGVVVESRNNLGQVVATTHIQYIIRVASGGSTNQSPVWDSPPTPADGTEFTVAPGNSVNFTMQASDPDSGDTVSILKSSGPGTFTPTDGNPATGAYSFTAANADLGQDFIVQFIAQDQDGAGPPFRSYTIKVRAAAATEGPVGDATCSDGIDNDGDGQIDTNDSDCVPGEGPPGDPTCSDGIDNDTDGDTDGADAGCVVPPNPCAGPGVISGTPGNDVIVGTNGDDVICAGAGDDRVNGRGGDDEIYGQAGNDILLGAADDDVVNGGTGDDNVNGGDHNDVLRGAAGNDTMPTGTGNDIAQGGDGTDELQGDGGDDALLGDDGDDHANGGVGHDRVEGGTGNDDLGGGEGNDLLGGRQGDDLIIGNEGNDAVNGNVGNDRIQGRDGDDRLFGQDGDDTISGQLGNDRVVGGNGIDRAFGNDGTDQVEVQDGVAGDLADCGPPLDDRFTADPGDTVVDCEIAA